ncbi:MAG: DUF72 domain-containing protein [Firmicutes bacterium]|nr:DUF72 domain-containing protein [Bacillota bacterium]
MEPLRIGCAGWSIPRASREEFPASGTHLQRYATRFRAVEIDSSFYRAHTRTIYERWAASTPEGFRFAVKLPRTVTHYGGLADLTPLAGFLDQVAGLGPRLGPLLVQLPPRLAFVPARVEAFFAHLREGFTGPVVCEPRHATWFTPEAEEILRTFLVARAAVDPAPVPAAAAPGGWPGLVYYRLHGSPRRYYSAYPPSYLQSLATKLLAARAEKTEVWCIFNNTATGAATADALGLMKICAEAEDKSEGE